MDLRLLRAAEAGDVILTANARLARYVRLDLARMHAVRSVPAWSAGNVIALHGWLAREHETTRWTAAGAAGVLLNPAQELRLWEQLIAEDRDADLVEAAAIARLARSAWTLMHAWRLPDPGGLSFASAEVQSFARWVRAYSVRCAREEWLDHARLPDALRAAYAAGVIAAPAGVLMLGFDRLTSQQRALLEALTQRGTRVETAHGPNHTPDARRMECATGEEELASAARSAVHSLVTGHAQRIGIVMPDLRARREQMRRALDDALGETHVEVARPMPPSPYGIAAEGALAELPLVRAGAAVLQVLTGRVALDDLTRVLLSPFISGGVAHAAERALFDAWLRERGVPDIDFARLPRLLAAFAESRRERPADTGLHAPFEGARAAVPPAGTGQSPDLWAAAMRRCLAAFGWPGERAQNAAEQRAVLAFDRALVAFASLELVQGALDASGALRLLDGLLANEPAPMDDVDARIQVLDLVEAGGLEFDELWIAGLDDEGWPPPVDPNPFIPIEWQRIHALPGATPQSQLDYARRVTQRLLAAARCVFVSHAVREGDRSRAPSPLVRDLERSTAREHLFTRVHRPSPQRSVRLELLHDDSAPAVTAALVRGGTRVLRLQAACPFRAYGELRLQAKPLERVASGLDARARGTLLHDALERVWGELGSWETLQRHDRAALDRVTRDAAGAALDAFEIERFAPLTPRRRAAEHARLSASLREWLDVERERAPFTVRELEAERTVTLAGLELTTRADRIDSLPDRSAVIIDYKSGVAQRRAPACWMGERPDDPQVPLYALAEEAPLAGVLLAHVRPGRSEFSGVARDAHVVPGVEPSGGEGADPAALCRQWRAVLHALAERYAAGDARVDPKHGPQTCRHCELYVLCRVAEARASGTGAVDG